MGEFTVGEDKVGRDAEGEEEEEEEDAEGEEEDDASAEEGEGVVRERLLIKKEGGEDTGDLCSWLIVADVPSQE
jgi:hypothetical protein